MAVEHNIEPLSHAQNTVNTSMTSSWFSHSSDLLIQYSINIFLALCILLVGTFLVKFIHKGVVNLLETKSVDSAVVQFISSFIRYALLVMVFIAALNSIGVAMTGVIAVLASASLAVGLALKGSLSNFASGVLIVLFRPFKSKDFIEVGKVSGTVQAIEIFHTVLTTGDNKMVAIPNRLVMSQPIVNFSKHKIRRINFEIRVSYDADLQKTKQVLAGVLKSEERILSLPAPTIGVLALANSSINIAVRPWVKSEEYWKVYYDTLQAIKEELDKEGIQIPFPQMDIHIK
ncbi:mechanosensitive ion channel domain-containing protein [Vibrio algivorus]|uniref:Small-conductance mechanosensitive channel n=1 Tax=Vibrio algivorus TaxID=1667024 RepID=A0ABQ6EKX8_9VIBR|nr:mechanosensitive ion channel domain-containing protein [Vibrio algivorus]GLT13426.1 mechanosensitive ion channel protein [Vibrio algivorus]